MLRFRTDLPLHRDTTARFLPWIIGCMVYLAALALAGTMAADRLAQRWHNELAGTFSIQIPAGSPAATGDRAGMIDGVGDIASNF